MYPYLYVRVYVYVSVYVCLCMYICLCVCICMYICQTAKITDVLPPKTCRSVITHSRPFKSRPQSLRHLIMLNIAKKCQDKRTRRPKDQRTKRPADQGSRGPRDQTTEEPENQGRFCSWPAGWRSTKATLLEKRFATSEYRQTNAG